eukprot:TRINITY_DN1345_c0_g2_i4.p1 TRINITY_DN1345_c0_g2~~TRINITY_DN1345_c0_g2_i4.p1  ORF type:complete len:2278 (+),score=246.92 TRINITY_DN1345_c0_g2_i4:71-6904(+)
MPTIEKLLSEDIESCTKVGDSLANLRKAAAPKVRDLIRKEESGNSDSPLYLSSTTISGHTLFFAMVMAGNIDVVKMMLSIATEKENLVRTGLLHTRSPLVPSPGNSQLSQPLSQPLLTNKVTCTAVHLACEFEDFEMLKCLIEIPTEGSFVYVSKQFFEVEADDGRTPVDVTLSNVMSGSVESIPLLSYLIQKSSSDVLMNALQKYQFNPCTLLGSHSILKIAISEGNDGFASALLESDFGIALLSSEMLFSSVVNLFVDSSLETFVDTVMKMSDVPEIFVKAALSKCGNSIELHSKVLESAVTHRNVTVTRLLSTVCDYQLLSDQLGNAFEQLSQETIIEEKYPAASASVLEILLKEGCEKHDSLPGDFREMVTSTNTRDGPLKQFGKHGTILHITAKGLMSNIFWAYVNIGLTKSVRDDVVKLAIKSTFEDESASDTKFLSSLLVSCIIGITDWGPYLTTIDDINKLITQEKSTLLSLACQIQTDESISLVKYLLKERNADCNMRTGSGDTALSSLWEKLADVEPSKVTVDLLLEAGADVNARNLNNESVLHHSLRNGSCFTSMFLRNKKMKLSTVKAALYPRVGMESSIDPFQTFPLSEGVHGTLLHMLAQLDTKDVAFNILAATRYLIFPFKPFDVFSFLNLQASNGETALEIACRMGHVDFVSLLVRRYQDMPLDITSALQASLRLPDNTLKAGVVTILLKRAEEKHIDMITNGNKDIFFGEWPLICMVAEAGKAGLMSVLLRNGANTSVSGPRGTVLHTAVMSVQPRIVAELLSRNVMTDEFIIRQHEGLTALSMAAQVYNRFEDVNGIATLKLLMERHLSCTNNDETLKTIIRTELSRLSHTSTYQTEYEVLGDQAILPSNLTWLTPNSPFLKHEQYEPLRTPLDGSRPIVSKQSILNLLRSVAGYLTELLGFLENKEIDIHFKTCLLYGCHPLLAFEMVLACVLYTDQFFHEHSGIQGVTTAAECSVPGVSKVVSDLKMFLPRFPQKLQHFYRGTEKKYLPRVMEEVIPYERFTSTSTDIHKAFTFAHSRSKPALLIGHSFSGGNIDDFSVFPEKEYLIPPGCQFKTLWVTSPTLIRNSSYRYYRNGELKVCSNISCAAISEVDLLNTNTAGTDRDQSKHHLKRIKDNAQMAYSVLFGGFLGSFISNDEGLEENSDAYNDLLGGYKGTYISNYLELVFPRKSENRDTYNVETLLEYWEKDGFGPKRDVPLCFEGDPGVGKTSAALKAITFLNNKKYFTLFVPLPKVENVFGWGAVDDYIAAHCIGLTCELEDLHQNATDLKPIVILESFDEISKSELQSQVHNIRVRNTTLLNYPCIVTTRSDFLSRLTSNDPTKLLGGSVRCYRLLPFNQDQRIECYRRDAVIKKGQANAALTPKVLKVLAGDTHNSELENPYILSITLDSVAEIDSRNLSLSDVTDMDILDAYLHQHNQDKLSDLINAMGKVNLCIRDLLCRIACLMLLEGVWEGQFFGFVDNFLDSCGGISSKDKSALRSLCGDNIAFFPFRTENENEQTVVGFSHKSLAEFLVANAIYSNIFSLETIFKDRNFSSEVPGVLHFFRQLVHRQTGSTSVKLRDPREIKSELKALLEKNEKEKFSAVAANSLSLLVSAGLSVHLHDRDEDLYLDNIHVRNVNLSHSCLAHISLKNAYLEKCQFEGSQFIECDFSGAVLKDSFFGVTRPLVKHQPPGVITGLSFSHNGAYLASATLTSLKITNIYNKVVKDINTLSPTVTGSQFEDLKNLVIQKIAFVPGSRHIAVGYSNGLISIYDIVEDSQVLNLGCHADAVTDIKVSSLFDMNRAGQPLGSKTCEVYSASRDRTVACWKLSPRKKEYVISHDTEVNCLAISELTTNCVRVVASASHKTLKLSVRKYEPEKEDIWTDYPVTDLQSRITAMQFRPSSASRKNGEFILIVGQADGSVRAMELLIEGKNISREKKTKNKRFRFRVPVEVVSAFQVLPGSIKETTIIRHSSRINSLFVVSEYLLTASDDPVVRIWELRDHTRETGPGLCKELRKLHGHKNGVAVVTCRLDSDTEAEKSGISGILSNCIASGSKMGDVFLWEASGRSRNRHRQGHSGSVTYALILEDGNVLSVGSDGTTRKWNTTTGKQEICETSGVPKPADTKKVGRKVACHKGTIILSDCNRPPKVRMCFGTMERLSVVRCTFDKTQGSGDIEILQMASTDGKVVDPSDTTKLHTSVGNNNAHDQIAELHQEREEADRRHKREVSEMRIEYEKELVHLRNEDDRKEQQIAELLQKLQHFEHSGVPYNVAS